MEDVITRRGKAWVFGDLLEADYHIISLDRLAEAKKQGLPLNAETLGKYCLEKSDPEFVNRITPGDILVAGDNTGFACACLDGDPDDPHFIGAASMALIGAGVGAVICESSAMNFLMNSLNLGLPVVECKGIRNKVSQGDELKLDLVAGTIANLTTGEEIRFAPYPDFLLDMVKAGGLYAQLAQEIPAGGD